MKTLFTSLFVFLACYLYSQNTTQATKNTSDFNRFQVGANFSPDVCYRILSNNDGSVLSENIIDLRNTSEIPKFGCSTGLNFTYNFNHFLGLQVGVQYLNRGYQSKDIALVNNNGDIISINGSKLISNFKYLGIPLKLNFTIGQKKVRFFTSVGFTTSFLLQQTTKSFYTFPGGKEEEHQVKNTYFKRLNIVPIVSAGIDYKINNRMNLRFEPTFRFGLLKITNTPVSGYLFSGGLNISYFYGF